MPIPRPPGTVTFDCWGTLLVDVDVQAALEQRGAALVSASRRRGLDLAPERARELIEAAWQEHVVAWRNGGLFGPEGAARWCLAQLGLDGGAGIIEELSDAIATGTLRSGTRVVEGAGAALEALRSRDIPTALICDTGLTPSGVVREALRHHGLALDHYFFSDEVGVPKPSPRIFSAALLAAGAEPQAAVHIGDLRRTDVAGARAAGMASIRFAGVHDDGWLPEDCRAEEADADAVLYHWDDLAALLDL